MPTPLEPNICLIPLDGTPLSNATLYRQLTEAEYRGLADTTQELLWLRWLLKDIGVLLCFVIIVVLSPTYNIFFLFCYHT